MKYKLVLLATLACSQAFAQTVPSRNLIPLNPDVTYGKLDNGLTYYIQPSGQTAGNIKLELIIRAGSRTEEKDQHGLAHVLEHLAFRKTAKYNSIWNTLLGMGLQAGYNFNASTEGDMTKYWISVPSNQLKTGLQLLSEMSGALKLDSSDIEAERWVVLNEIGMPDSAQASDNGIYSFDQHLPRTLHGDRLGVLHFKHPPLIRFYKKWYIPQYEAVIVSGKIDPAEVLKEIKNAFSMRLAKGKPAAFDATDLTFRPRTEDYMVQRVGQWQELIFRQTYERPLRILRTAGDYANNVLINLFDLMAGERVRQLKNDNNWQDIDPVIKYASANRYHTNYEAPEGPQTSIAFGKQADSATIASCFQHMFTAEEQIVRHGFTQEELNAAKEKLLRQLRGKAAAGDDTDQYQQHFTYGVAAPGYDYEINTTTAILDSLTLNAMNSVARNWYRDAKPVTTLSVKKGSTISEPSKQILQAWRNTARQSDIPAYVFRAPQSTLKILADSTLSRLHSLNHYYTNSKVSEVGATVLGLNGMKLILRPDAASKVINIRGFKKGNMPAAYETYAAASMAPQMVSNSAMGGFRMSDLKKLPEDKLLRVGGSCYPHEMYIAGEATDNSPQGQTELAQLLYAFMNAPGIDETAYQQTLKSPNFPIHPQGEMDSLYRMYMHFPDDKAQAGISKITKDMAYDEFKKGFGNADGWTFIVTGNFDTDTMSNKLITYLGGMPSIRTAATAPSGKTWPDQGFINMGTKETMKTTDLLFYVNVETNVQNNLRQAMLAAITQEVLWQKLRGEMGAVYVVIDGTKRASKNLAFTSFFFESAENLHQQVLDSALHIIRNMKKETVDPAVIDSIKKRMLETAEKGVRSSDDWQTYFYNRFLDDNNLKNIADIDTWKAELEKITPEVLRETAKKYFPTDNMMITGKK